MVAVGGGKKEREREQIAKLLLTRRPGVRVPVDLITVLSFPGAGGWGWISINYSTASKRAAARIAQSTIYVRVTTTIYPFELFGVRIRSRTMMILFYFFFSPPLDHPVVRVCTDSVYYTYTYAAAAVETSRAN